MADKTLLTFEGEKRDPEVCVLWLATPSKFLGWGGEGALAEQSYQSPQYVSGHVAL